MLVIFSGLPGTGTTTIAKAVAASRTVVYPRVDAIEHALAQGASPAPEIGPVGYLAATGHKRRERLTFANFQPPCAPLSATTVRHQWPGFAR
jgi:predicted kinase